jgi:TPR repeat protein
VSIFAFTIGKIAKRAAKTVGTELVHVAANQATRKLGEDSLIARLLSDAHVTIHQHTAPIPIEHYSQKQCEDAAAAEINQHNYGSATRWLEMGIERGSVSCLWLKGACYRDGKGVQADMRAAAQCFIDAMGKGDETTAPLLLNEVAATYGDANSPWHNIPASIALYELVAGCANAQAAATARLQLALLMPPRLTGTPQA